MLWIEVLILIVLVVGFFTIGRIIQAMRQDIREQLDTLQAELAETETVAEGVVALLDSQNEKLKALADSGKDGDEIAAELHAIVAETDAVKVKLGNAVAANTAATSEDKPIETPVPEPTPAPATDTGATDKPADPVAPAGGSDEEQPTG